MVNRHRGEIEAMLDGRRWTLCLTLGALAELEDAFSVADMGALAERFAEGRLCARDAVRIIAAGLRGAGNMVEDEQVAAMTAAGGAPGFAAIVGDLLRATFGGADSEGSEAEWQDFAGVSQTPQAREAGESGGPFVP
ncbi:tail tube GTA-gp10-like protein [Breoghania corrubedonensis]|uniref:Tail tube GTA-gp10-like protein n=1 Tax=Breoghania corrubedonensis TaxID=665038 RepID=A0A2T5V1L7_9HYPH|nr:gene transfer agent family protein [Breoghania corrubedonensis]PTW57654.1 tail tube GTA-gp10-like protein [Breoghania corrubedonensis]